MAAKRKSFKNSPAMQFLSVPEPTEEPPESANKGDLLAVAASWTDDPLAEGEGAAVVEQIAPGSAPVPGDPEGNSAFHVSDGDETLAGLAPSSADGPPQAAAGAPQRPTEGRFPARKPLVGQGGGPLKPNPEYIETRSKRVQLLMQPSLHARLKDAAAVHEVSLNDLVHNVLEEYLDTEAVAE